jgi:hypothetical protein
MNNFCYGKVTRRIYYFFIPSSLHFDSGCSLHRFTQSSSSAVLFNTLNLCAVGLIEFCLTDELVHIHIYHAIRCNYDHQIFTEVGTRKIVSCST